jgi:YidC/Oxa1 family membrane protein insertase
MFYLLEFIKGIVGNFGIAILIATVLVKLAVFPLANKSYASMSKMKKLQPEMVKLKELYPDDKMKQQQGMMELYKREKVSPISGCLPVVVQIPVFFSLYKVILTSIELRHAPFYGWVHDLSAADPTNLFTLFGLIPWSPPLFLALGIWPLLMGITMWVQMRLNPTPPDPVQASLFNWMPIIFTFMLGSFPVGLVIYWAWSNLLSILQQSVIMKRHGVDIDLLGNIRESLPFLKKKTAAT